MCRGGSGVARGGRGGATRPGAELVRWPRRARCFGLSGLCGAPRGRFSPKSPGRPAQAKPSFRRTSPAPRRVSKGPSTRTERLCGPSTAWHLADAPLAAGEAAAWPAVWEPRGPASSRPSSCLRALPPPPARAARPQSRLLARRAMRRARR